ncbi:MAG: hypothetical protein R3E52_07050 [Burkholderiaceae bacterium]
MEQRHRRRRARPGQHHRPLGQQRRAHCAAERPCRPASPRNTILGNSIFGNGALGIELIDITVIPPLGGQPRRPAAINGGQAAPAITSALVGGGGVQLAYQFSGPPGQAYYIEVFTNSACDASGYGEGRTLLTRINLPDASGGQHTAQLQPLLPGTVLTLTATAHQGQSPTGSVRVLALPGRADRWRRQPPAGPAWHRPGAHAGPRRAGAAQRLCRRAGPAHAAAQFLN